MDGDNEPMSNEKPSDDRKPYLKPSVSVHGDVRIVTRANQMGTGGPDGMAAQGNLNFKTS